MRREVTRRKELANEAREAGNALNRQDTAVKNSLRKVLDEVGANVNDSVVLDGELISYRPNITNEIDPRTWYQWYQERRISENQFFGALNVIVSEAKAAIGEDQLPDVQRETLTKTSAVRIEAIPPEVKLADGDIKEFSQAPTKEEARKKVVASTPAPPTKKPAKRVVRLGR